ncbi:Uncharacterised protein [Mycobacteroides abscessus subsp. abscessus]|nr:Uncharacterised protein [Mycobacteroides abscessus subsp. abscessus]
MSLRSPGALPEAEELRGLPLQGGTDDLVGTGADSPGGDDEIDARQETVEDGEELCRVVAARRRLCSETVGFERGDEHRQVGVRDPRSVLAGLEFVAGDDESDPQRPGDLDRVDAEHREGPDPCGAQALPPEGDDVACRSVLPDRTDVPPRSLRVRESGDGDRLRDRARALGVGELDGDDRLGGCGHLGTGHHSHGAAAGDLHRQVPGRDVAAHRHRLPRPCPVEGEGVEGISVHRRGGEPGDRGGRGDVAGEDPTDRLGEGNGLRTRGQVPGDEPGVFLRFHTRPFVSDDPKTCPGRVTNARPGRMSPLEWATWTT